MNKRNDIFGSFTPMSPEQIKGNIKFVSLWLTPFLIVFAGVLGAVTIGNVWIAATAGVICVSTLIFIASIKNVKYVPQFSFSYNLLRALICGFLVYGGSAWGGLLGIYNFFVMEDGRDMSTSLFSLIVMAISLAIILISKYILYNIANVQIADLVGLIEITALALFIGSLMFMLLYT